MGMENDWMKQTFAPAMKSFPKNPNSHTYKNPPKPPTPPTLREKKRKKINQSNAKKEKKKGKGFKQN